MQVPQALKHNQAALVRTVTYNDESLIVVDFGPTKGSYTLDVVGETAIVTTDTEQFEFELPKGATDITMNNSVLTITE